jgi:hypothetical protein
MTVTLAPFWASSVASSVAAVVFPHAAGGDRRFDDRDRRHQLGLPLFQRRHLTLKLGNFLGGFALDLLGLRGGDIGAALRDTQRRIDIGRCRQIVEKDAESDDGT